ncbi:hypothetical protein C2I18_05850 [Paenibacillus sp. PK3_47]|uniref:glycosyltransferase n=1 Tax=Paenibacillus sp. PK3_47 TaxID=2072642 RepID=UPI00201D7FD9|nr:glycosyltransferase [Paenibacillus sp. PK3_47]UQZ33122.1 hypothetical protein C2I18_05850 [Paenibacillus sp. PK3_47]
MRNALYIVYDYENYKNKISGQLNAISAYRYNTFLLTINAQGECFLYEYVNKNLIEIERVKINGYKKYTLVNRRNLRDLIQKYLLKYDFKAIYFRRLGLDITGWAGIFKKIKEDSTRLIFYEFPTYPFDKIKTMKYQVANLFEKIYFNLFIYKYLDFIPVILQNDCVLDKKMIPFNNGIDEKMLTAKNENQTELSNTINVLALAHVNYWHGYDRALKSIALYKGKLNIILDIISDETQEILNLKKMSLELGIEKNVNFIKYNDVDNLDAMLSNYHVALGGIGYFRRNAKYDTSIKNKEYCAKGLPFIITNTDLSFPQSFKYQFQISKDETIFDWDMIISWYKSFKDEDYKNEMIRFAEDNLLYVKQMKNVLEKMSYER